jgi:hypothetical protein
MGVVRAIFIYLIQNFQLTLHSVEAASGSSQSDLSDHLA